MATASNFDVDEFIGACRAALAETDSQHAVREVVQRPHAEEPLAAVAFKLRGGQRHVDS